MIGLMADSDDLAVLADARLAGMRIATYADIVTPEFLARYGGRLTVIDRGRGDPHGVATVADCEPGALSPQESVARVQSWHDAGRHQPTIYHNRANWDEVNTAGQGVPFAHWVATLDGTLVPSGYYMAVVQFAGAKQLGFHADLSVIWDDAWHAPDVPATPLAVDGLRSTFAALEHCMSAFRQAIAAL